MLDITTARSNLNKAESRFSRAKVALSHASTKVRHTQLKGQDASAALRNLEDCQENKDRALKEVALARDAVSLARISAVKIDH